MLEKIKEIAYKKKSAPIIARIDEMMQQINNRSKTMFKFRYKGEYFTFEGYTFDDAINDMDLMLNLNGKNNWVQSQYEPEVYRWIA